MEVITPPWKVCGKIRPELEAMVGYLSSWVPIFSSVFERRAFAVKPNLLYSSGARPSLPTGKRPVPLRPAEESSFRPSIPKASTPKPTMPGV
ncbi:hypothetical protein D3C76_1109300 [compost metagenome]